MPFKSEKQRRLLWAKHPDIAKRWAHEYPESNKNLPMYANKKENSAEDMETSGKEAQIALSRAILEPILTQFSGNRPPLHKKSNSILEHVEMPQSDSPTAAGDKHIEVAGSEGNSSMLAEEKNKANAQGGSGALCSNVPEEAKAAELNKIAQILRKKAIVLSHPLRTIMKPILDGIQAGMEARNHVGIRGPGTGRYGNGNGAAAGLGFGVLNGQANGQGTAGNGQGTQGTGGNLGPAPPKGSFLPRLVGKGYEQYLQSARSQLTQARMNSVIPPPIGSTGAPTPPSVVASFPGMNSAPKTAAILPSNALKPIQPVSPHFQASNIVAKNQSQFAKGNDALLNTIGKLSPFKTIGGKIDNTAGLLGGSYGNLPNTPKDIHKG